MSYGSDIWCFDQPFTGRLASGVDVVAQAIYRRLTTPRGTLRGGEEESVYGLDLLDFVGTVGTTAALDALPPVVEAETLKDDRILSADVTATFTISSAGEVAITLQIECVLRDSDEEFALTLGISDVAVSLLGVTT
jgi:hypothetical protein